MSVTMLQSTTGHRSVDAPQCYRSSINSLPPLPADDLLKVIPHELLDKQCSEILLCDVAKDITDWQLLRPYIKMSKSDENDLIRNHPGSNALQKQKLLQQWQEKFGKRATHRALVTAIYKSGDVDCAWKVCRMVSESSVEEVAQSPSSSLMGASTLPSAMAVSSSSASSPATAAPSPAMLSYQDQLRRGYRTHKPVMVVEWPPPPALKYISLAMIKKETVERGSITNEYICTTIHGNMDDILHEKVPVEVDQLFSLGSDERKVILVEGAPGSGKSTLLWHICQKWQSGELFQQFTLVLLVLLRDTAVHTAQSLADILPCVPSRSSKYTPSKYRKAIASDIEDRHGEGVLIMLDGWDEAPTNLQQEGSLFHDIIADPSKCSVEAAAVVVSSRPSASHDIRKYASTRVEVIGFTRERREEYVRESLPGKPEAAHSLLQQIESVPQLGANCHLPLNLVIITHTFLCSGNTLPSTYCRIVITLALSCLLRHIKKSTAHGTAVQSLESFSDLPDGTREEFLKLCKLAYEGVVKEKYSFSSEDLREITQSSATGVPQITTFGLLQAVHSLVATGSSTVYHFLHLSLQELCAALYIASLPSPETEHVRALKRMVNSCLESELAGDDPKYTLTTHFQSVCEFYSALTRLHNYQVVSELLHIYTYEDEDDYDWDYCYDRPGPAIACHGASLRKESFFECLAEADNPELTAEIIGTRVWTISSGQALASAIEQAPHLESVSCVKFPPAFSKVLSGKTSLKSLGISYCIDMEHVKHVLKTCTNLEHFGVSGRFGDAEVSHLAEVLNQTSIQTLALGGEETEEAGIIGETGIITLSSALKTNNTIQQLTVRCKDVGPHGQEALMAALSHSTSLTELKITAVQHCRPFPEDDRALFSGLKEVPSLTKFSLSYRRCRERPKQQHMYSLLRLIRDEAPEVPPSATYVGETLLSGNLVELADILKLNRPPAVDKQIQIDFHDIHVDTCMTIDFKNMHFVSLQFSEKGNIMMLRKFKIDIDMEQLTESLTKVAVVEIDLSYRKISNTGAAHLAKVMGTEKLNISCCGIGEEEMAAFSSGLSNSTTLKCLKARWNTFGDKGATHLAVALNHTSLQEIDISRCGIGEEGMVTLSSALKTNTTLKQLDISRNSSGEEGIIALSSALKTNTTLKHLYAQENKFGDRGASHLAVALNHTSLRGIDISCCGIGDEGMVALFSALSTNTTLQYLNIYGNDGRDKGIIALSSALKTNTSLIHLEVSLKIIENEPDYAVLWEISGHSQVALARAIIQNTTLTSLNCTCLWLHGSLKFTREVTQELLKDTSTFYTGIKRSPIVQRISIDRTSSLGEALWSGNMEEAAEILELNQPPAVEKTLKIKMSNNTWEVDYGARKVSETDEGLLKVRSIYNDPTSWSSLHELTLTDMVLGGVGACLLAEMLNETQIEKLDIRRCRIPEDGIVALSLVLGTNTTLKHLTIGGNSINERGQKALARALTRNTTLAVLDISSYEVDLPSWTFPLNIPFHYKSFKDDGDIFFQSLNQFFLSIIVYDSNHTYLCGDEDFPINIEWDLKTSKGTLLYTNR